MKGLYLNSREDSFTPDTELQKLIKPTYEIPIKQRNTDFHRLIGEAKRKQEASHELDKTQEKGRVVLPKRSLINFMADLHIGGEHTDYERIEQEVDTIIRTPNSYCILVGDLVDAFFFNPAQFEDIEQTPAQVEYARSMCKYLADNNKLLAVWNGNHDMWIKRMGFDPYTYILEGIDTYYFHGQANLDIVAKGEKYKTVGNHMQKGNSIYNNTHPQNRAVRFGGAFGADLVFSGHWHQKGIAQQVFTGYDAPTLTTMMALGTYKSTDEYIRTYGFQNRNPIEMYGESALLDGDKHVLQPYWDILEANAVFTN